LKEYFSVVNVFVSVFKVTQSNSITFNYLITQHVILCFETCHIQTTV